jgi:hypothetical protein
MPHDPRRRPGAIRLVRVAPSIHTRFRARSGAMRLQAGGAPRPAGLRGRAAARGHSFGRPAFRHAQHRAHAAAVEQVGALAGCISGPGPGELVISGGRAAHGDRRAPPNHDAGPRCPAAAAPPRQAAPAGDALAGLPRPLRDACAVLQAPRGTVYVLGVSHVSSVACDQVRGARGRGGGVPSARAADRARARGARRMAVPATRTRASSPFRPPPTPHTQIKQLIGTVKPEVVVVELCKDRATMLVDPETNQKAPDTWICTRVEFDGLPGAGGKEEEGKDKDGKDTATAAAAAVWPGAAELAPLLTTRIGRIVTTAEVEGDVAALEATGLFGRVRPLCEPGRPGDAPLLGAVKAEEGDGLELEYVAPLGCTRFLVEPRKLPAIKAMSVRLDSSVKVWRWSRAGAERPARGLRGWAGARRQAARAGLGSAGAPTPLDRAALPPPPQPPPPPPHQPPPRSRTLGLWRVAGAARRGRGRRRRGVRRRPAGRRAHGIPHRAARADRPRRERGRQGQQGRREQQRQRRRRRRRRRGGGLHRR